MTKKLETKGFVYVCCQIKMTTERAVLAFDGVRSAWVPKSQIEAPEDDEIKPGETVDLLLPEWLALDLKFI